MSATVATKPASGLRELGDWAASVSWSALRGETRDRLLLVLEDTLGVAIAGAQTPELRQLRAVQPVPPGPARVLGTAADRPVELGAWLNGTATCALELDEGSRYARGHPAAHAFPAALAVAQERESSGIELCEALLAGHEVAARLGRATTLRTGTHPHGNWGVGGAAAAAGRLLGLDGRGIAEAIDAAGTLALATPFHAALSGSFVRNTWIGAANANGIAAARLVAAGLGREGGDLIAGLGLLGDVDTAELSADLGRRHEAELGYFKRHACCSYTHPPADAALELRRRNPGLDWSAVREIEVATHRLAVPLARRELPTRLAAMFSIPHVVAVALLHGDCSPARFDRADREDPLVRRLVERTQVSHDPELDRRLPDERAARLTVTVASGESLEWEVPNPVGDAAHLPLSDADVGAKLTALLEPYGLDAGEVRRLVRELPRAPAASDVLRALPRTEER